MTQDEIIRMAREAGFEVVDGQLRLYFDGSKALLKPNYMGTVVDGLKEFATIVAAHWQKIHEQEMSMMSELCADRILEEREACAKVCETEIEEGESPWTACDYAATIRSRSN